MRAHLLAEKLVCEEVRGQSVDIPLKLISPRNRSGACFRAWKVGAGGGNRTHTPVKVADFKSD